MNDVSEDAQCQAQAVKRPSTIMLLFAIYFSLLKFGGVGVEGRYGANKERCEEGVVGYGFAPRLVVVCEVDEEAEGEL